MKNAIKSLIAIIVLVCAGILFIKPESLRFGGEAGRSPGPSWLFNNGRDPQKLDGTVIVSAPVIPTIGPAFATLPTVRPELYLDREVNPRSNQTGNVYTGAGGILGGIDPLLQIQADAPAAVLDDGFAIPIVNIAGQGYTFVNPPDTVGDVGPNHYVQSINGGGGALVQIYDKDGNTLGGPWSMDSLGSGSCASGFGDPVVLYDPIADRWMLTEFAGSGNHLCIYISQTPDPVTSNWYAYDFSTPNFPDYPKYGVWPDAYYVASNENSPAAYALDRVKMLAGLPATSQRFTAPALAGFGFQALTPADLDGPVGPPAGAPGLFMRHNDDEAHFPGSNDPTRDFLQIFAFDVDWTTPANSTFAKIADIEIAEIDSELCGFFAFACFPMPGTSTTLDPLREVVMFRLAYRNFGDHETLVGNLVTDVDGTDHGGVRWFELRKSGGPWGLYQEGTFAPDANHRWMGAIAMDSSGNIALGYNTSSSTVHPDLRYVGRLSSDPLGTMPQGEYVLIDGTASNGSNRYGDYSAMSVDPADDCTFWFTGEYNTASQWSTRIGAFKFDACGQPDFTLSANPNTQAVCTPNDAVYTINVGQVQSYTDTVTLSASGQPSGTTAGFSPNPLTPPGASTLTIGNTGSAAFGSYDINVVGTAPTSTHTTTVTLDVYTGVPGAPGLVSPANGSSGVAKKPTFTWNGSTQASLYELEAATDAGFSNVVYSAAGIAGTSHAAANALDPLTTYFWHVRAGNTCGDGGWSTTFSFTTEDIPPILLVDDDDDSPDVLSYWTDTLDALNLSYDIWTTGSADVEPGAADIAPYALVLWFSGDRFGTQNAGPAGPSAATETALASWLNGGGCFFITAQDYVYDKGVTSFMTGYLGIANATNDNGDYTSVTGENLFSGLGPYSLTYPYTDYSDPLTVGNGGLTAMLGNNGKVGGTIKETANYKTSFWAFGLEALPAAGREASLQTFVDWCGLPEPPTVYNIYLPIVVKEP